MYDQHKSIEPLVCEICSKYPCPTCFKIFNGVTSWKKHFDACFVNAFIKSDSDSESEMTVMQVQAKHDDNAPESSR